MAERISKLTDVQCDSIARAVGITLPPAPDTGILPIGVLRKLINTAYMLGRDADVMFIKYRQGGK